MLKYIIILLVQVLSMNLYAQEGLGKIKNYFRVDEVRVSGAKKVEPEAIIEKVNIKKGEMLSNYSLREAIKSIYALKYFEAVEAKAIE